MGVDISHIIKNDFNKGNDEKAVREYILSTISLLKERLCIFQDLDSFEVDYDDIGLASFHLPVYDVKFLLFNGFWDIEPNCHYCQIVIHRGNYFALRRIIYDIARALGRQEAWHVQEYYTWNSPYLDDPETTFEEWYANAAAQYGKPIPEYDQAAILAQGDVAIPDYEPVYHDSFAECAEAFNALQAQLPGYRLLGLLHIGSHYLRCEKEGMIYLVGETTLKPMPEMALKSMDRPLNGPEFVIERDGLSAVFDGGGQQLTDFVTGTWDWKWAPIEFGKPDFRRIIFNKDAGIELPPR